MTGTIIRIVEEKGYGFIRPHDRRETAFFLARELSDDLEWSEALTERDVEFDLVEMDDGRFRAKNIRPAR